MKTDRKQVFGSASDNASSLGGISQEAAALGHECLNAITVIMGQCELLEVGDKLPVRKQKILDAARTATKLVQRLLALQSASSKSPAA